MKISKVTAWSAETANGMYYAEQSQEHRFWVLHKMRGRGRGVIGKFPSFKAVKAEVEVLTAKKGAIGIIPLDLYNLDVGVFSCEADRHFVLAAQGVKDLAPATGAALASAYREFTEDGNVRFSMVIKPKASKAVWAHECVHIADFVIDFLSLPATLDGTEVRAYMVQFLFERLEKIMAGVK